MILLFLCAIFFDEERASVKCEYLDYSITDFWWKGTPKFNATEKMTPPYPFLPTPKGHGQYPFPGAEGEDTFTSYPPPNLTIPLPETSPAFPNVSRAIYLLPSTKNYIEDHPFTEHIQYPGITLPPNFPSDYKYPTVLPTLYSARYIPSPTGPTPKGPSFTLPDVQRPIYFYPTGSSTTSPTIPDWVPPSTTPRPSLPPVSWDPVDLYVQMWKKKIASDAAAGGTPSDVVPVLRSVVNYDWKVVI